MQARRLYYKYTKCMPSVRDRTNSATIHCKVKWFSLLRSYSNTIQSYKIYCHAE